MRRLNSVAAATTTQTEQAPVPESLHPDAQSAPAHPVTYLKTHCEKAFAEIAIILKAHQNKPECNHVAVKPLLRMLFQAKEIAEAEYALNNTDPHVSPEAAAHLHDLITTLRSMLLCPLSRQALVDPVIDPLAESPYRLAFEAAHLARFYQLQTTPGSLMSTDCAPVNPDVIPAEFAPHLLIKDLCLWLATYFPEPTEEVKQDAAPQTTPNMMQSLTQWVKSYLPAPVAVVNLPDLTTYTFHLACTSEQIAEMEREEAIQQHAERHLENRQRLTDTKFQLAESKLQTERLIREETERLEHEILSFKAQCDARCEDLKKANLTTEERLKQEQALRAALDKKLQDIQTLYWEKIGEFKLAKDQLETVQKHFSQLSTQHASTEQQLQQTKASLTQTNSSYQQAMASLSSLGTSYTDLSSEVSSLRRSLDRANDEYREEIRRLRNSCSGSSCTML